ncbi:MAG: ABC transporter permease subunit, partial [Acidobacteriota bacterium]
MQPVVVRSPEPLSVLDQGLEAHLGSDVTIHLFEIPVEATGGYLGNEFLARSPAADLTAIVTVVLGLLALLLAHDAIQSERDSGKLAALVASGVPRDTLITGKILGGLLALMLPLGGALLVSLMIFVLQVGEVIAPSQWMRAAGLAIAYVFYLSLMFLLGLFISLTVQRRSRALAAAVVAWLALIILLPGVTRTLVADLWSAREARSGTELLAARDRLLEAERRREPLRTKFSRDSAVSFASGENRAVR